MREFEQTRVIQIAGRRVALAAVAAVWVLALCWPAAAHSSPVTPAKSPAACASVPYGSPASATPDSEQTRNLLPPNPDGPTLVGLSFFVVNLREINPRTDSFDFHGYLKTTWCDPRLATDPVKEGARERVFTGEAAQSQKDHIWFPRGYSVNQVGDLKISERVLRIHPDGTVQQDLNVSVRLQAAFDLRRFPFDRQILQLQVESYAFDRNAVQFVSDESRTGFAEELELPEWSIKSTSQRVEDVEVMRSDVDFSRLFFEIEMARKPGFYLWKVMLPLFLIIALSWSIFWMTDEPLAGRSRISATGVLTVVAYQFVIAESLPRVSYLTLLDQIMIFSFILLAITVLQSMLVAQASRIDYERALHIDRISRWAFPLVYALIMLAIWLAAG